MASKKTVAKGIDVSHWQGTIDFDKVKKSGIDFVILKAGGSDNGFYKDSTFEKNYIAAKRAGLNIGAYYFVGKNFKGAVNGKADAVRFHTLIYGYSYSMPVYVDIESTSPKDKEAVTEAAIAFCKYMEEYGYFVGIYASDISGFKERLNHEKLLDYSHWVARYGGRIEVCKEAHMRQTSSTGKVNGINGDVDLDESYIDFPAVIKKAHKNGY